MKPERLGFGSRVAIAGTGVFLLVLGCASSDAAGPRPESWRNGATDARREAAIMAVLDRYLAALNRLDVEAHVETYHFPHFRLAAGNARARAGEREGERLAVWQTPAEAMPILAVPPAERRAALRAALGAGWDRSEWLRREIVQADDRKAHVVTRFVRLRADGSRIASFDSLYVMTFEGGRWAIKGRSSFAP